MKGTHRSRQFAEVLALAYDFLREVSTASNIT